MMRPVAYKSKDKWNVAINGQHMPESLPYAFLLGYNLVTWKNEEVVNDQT